MKLKAHAILNGPDMIQKIYGPDPIPDPPGRSGFNEGGGSGIFPAKKPFCPNLPFLASFTLPSSDGDPEQTETNFKNLREVFGQHRMRNKTLFSVFATELRAEQVEGIFGAYFSIFSIFSFSPDFAGAAMASWR
jgi:hypothetical protein